MKTVVVIGAGPAGLMAADVLSAAGQPVVIYDAMPSPARKFLRAGIGGLNLTHSESADRFVTRYGDAQENVARWLNQFGQDQVRDFAHTLGIETFVGSSGRVFPKEMKGAPMLRAWLGRLTERRVRMHLRHRWLGWTSAQGLEFATAGGTVVIPEAERSATLLALGGASWPRLGSDGSWTDLLGERGIKLNAFRPANGGFSVSWSDHMRNHAGAPVKGIALHHEEKGQRGEFVVTDYGIEGGVVYALGASLRDGLERAGTTTAFVDLCPDRSRSDLFAALSHPRGRDSLANHLRRRVGLTGIKAALLRELSTPEQLQNPATLAAAIKALPLTVSGTRPLAEAISTAGGIALAELDERLMLRQLPGVFAAGEMLDWEAPTGGYLLTAVMASGHVAGHGILDFLSNSPGN